MLSSIRKFSTSFMGKIVIALIAIAFIVGFGMSGSFGGKQNIVAEVNGEKISSQEFVEYLQQRVNLTKEDVLRAGGKSELLQQVLMNYISEKIISIESEKKGLLLTEKSLLKTLIEDRKFQKDGKFSETKYEKFMLSNGLTKVFYENLIKETEIKANVKLNKTEAEVNLEENERGISPGQACVFYLKNNFGDRVLGGGWIVKTVAKYLST